MEISGGAKCPLAKFQFDTNLYPLSFGAADAGSPIHACGGGSSLGSPQDRAVRVKWLHAHSGSYLTLQWWAENLIDATQQALGTSLTRGPVSWGRMPRVEP